MDSAKRVMSGTWTEVWLDAEYVGEAYGLQAKVKFTKEKINLCGQLAVDTKIVATEGTGSLRMHKVNSRMSVLVGEKVARGEDPRFVLVSKNRDPDADGAERFALSNASFDDETLADWEAGKLGKVECPFTFTKREWLDLIQPK